jgi:uncharacterized membrane protein
MKHFLSRLDHERIVAGIRDAESRSTGEIRAHVTRRKPPDIEAAARARFEKLGMAKTAERNGVLFYICPNQRRFRILGDAGVHEKCGDDFWQEVAAAMEEKFRRGHFTDGLLEGIARVGDVLARHFPRKPGGKNELSDEVTED